MKLSKAQKHLIQYPINKGLNYTNSWGYSLFILILLQISTGIILSCFYSPSVENAHQSINYIIREIHFGFYIQRYHAIGANIIFLLITLHVLRNIYYQVTHCVLVWWTGFLLFVSLILISFTGYVLPWGQMSYWGVIVITNLVSIIPFIGYWLLHILWGGTAIGDLLLKRCFILHFLLSLILLFLIIAQIYTLHINKTSLIKKTKISVLPEGYKNLYPNFIIKDSISIFIIIIGVMLILLYYPFIFDNPTNVLPANSVVTPKHIIPEIYFLVFYSALKLIPSKSLGICCMGGFVISFLIYLQQKNKLW